MATASLLKAISFPQEPPRFRQSSFKWNPLFPKSKSQLPFRIPNLIRFCSQSALKPSAATFTQEKRNPVLRAILETLRALQWPVAAAVLLDVLLTRDPYAALAASGGRIGGRSSSSPPPSQSRSYSAPSGSGFSYSAPYYAGGGFYAVPAFGVGLGAGSGFFLLTMGFAAVILLSGFLSDQTDD